MVKQIKLNYALGALEPYIDKETMNVHYNKHHAAYTNKTTVILDALKIRTNPNKPEQARNKPDKSRKNTSQKHNDKRKNEKIRTKLNKNLQRKINANT